MKTFTQPMKLKNIRYDIRGRVNDKAEEMIAQGIPVLKLNTGNPAQFGFYAPQKFEDIIIKNMKLAQAYSPSQGLLSARQAIAKYSLEKGIQHVDENDVIIGEGVSELILLTMQALLDPEDEVLVPAPDYPLWTSAVHFASGTPVHYICDEENSWYPDIEDIKSKINPQTKAMVLINPNNPTGAVYPKHILKQIAAIARENDLIVFSDEIYDRLLYDNVVHRAFASLAPDCTVVTFNGLSKSHCVAGFRCGWLVVSGVNTATKAYVEGLKKLASIRICSNVLAQSLIPAALSDNSEMEKRLMPDGDLYNRREAITTSLEKIAGVSVVKPQAGLYIFPKLDPEMYNITDDEDFVYQLLIEHNILLTHGRAYNIQTTDHLRIVFLPSAENLQAVSYKLSSFLENYRR